MTNKFYLDTCIWRDYLEDRKDRFRPLGEWAHRLIRKIIDDSEIIIISDILLKELGRDLTDDQIRNMLGIIPVQLIMNVYHTETQARLAMGIKKRNKIPFNDALHSVIARECAAVLVSRDSHLLCLPGSEVFKPEDLL
ncbi:MAG: PIN domain-containing protein [Candidatus Woesearchaeota archaeon]